MKNFWLLIFFIFMSPVQAHVMTITRVKVSVTADSSAKARDQALEQAHTQAFQKLLTENFPEKTGPIPPPETLMNMVKDFSIDREKATSTGYTASFTFQFDVPKVERWVNQGQTQAQAQAQAHDASLPSQKVSSLGQILKMTVSYETLSEWHRLKKALQEVPGVQLTVGSFSSNAANVELVYGGEIEKLKQYLLQQGFLLSPQEEAWIISSNRSK